VSAVQFRPWPPTSAPRFWRRVGATAGEPGSAPRFRRRLSPRSRD